ASQGQLRGGAEDGPRPDQTASVTGTAGPVANRWTPLRVAGEVELAGGRTGHGPDPVVAVPGITTPHPRPPPPPDGMAAVDLRGRGDSGKPASGYGFKTHASDLLRVLDHLGIER